MDIIGVVVLNYIKYKETISCVDSLLNQEGIILKIVIVDNGSQNDSLQKLSDRYVEEKKVTILSSPQNLGYSKGNNLGISFLLSINVKNIFIANSDLLFSKSGILKQINDAREPKVGLIVPTIKNPDGRNDQRVIYKKSLFTLRMAKELIKSLWRDYKGTKLAVANTNYMSSDIHEAYDDKYVVSGSGFLLTDSYFNSYEGLYSPIFLYGEECATMILIHRAGLSTKVINTDVILHKGGASTPENIGFLSEDRCKINFDSDKKILRLLIFGK